MLRVKLTILRLIFGVIPGVCGYSAGATGEWAEAEKVREVLAGERAEANVLWWGYDSEDSTRYIQAAIDSGARRVVVPHVESPWMVKPLTLTRDNQTIVLEEGVLIRAIPGSIRSLSDHLFTIRNRNNVALQGHGARLEVDRTDFYRRQLRRGGGDILHVSGSDGVVLEGLSLHGAVRDGIYIGAYGSDSDHCRNIIIRNVRIEESRRQAISVISVENLLIEDSVLERTSGAAPMAAIDFEPNHARERLVNITMRRVETRNNGMAGYYFFFTKLNSNSIPISIRIEDCVSINDFKGIHIRRLKENGVRGSIEFHNTRVEQPLKTAVKIDDKTVDSAAVVFTDCLFEASATSAIVFDGGENWGGVEFVRCIVEDWMDRPVVAVRRKEHPAAVSGTILLRSSYVDGRDQPLPEGLEGSSLRIASQRHEVVEKSSVELPDVPFQPVSDQPLETVVQGIPVRNSAVYLLYADRGEQVEIEVKALLDRAYRINVYAPDEAVIKQISSQRKGIEQIAFKAGEAGLYRIEVLSPYVGNMIALSTSARLSLIPRVFYQRDLGNRVKISGAGNLYFRVPQGTGEFILGVFPWGKGTVESAKIINSSGEVVAHATDIGRSHRLPGILSVRLDRPSSGEIWQLQLSGTAAVQIFDPIPPALAFSPRALLVP